MKACESPVCKNTVKNEFLQLVNIIFKQSSKHCQIDLDEFKFHNPGPTG